MEYLLGFGIAGLISISASLIGFDKDRAFYAVVLIVIASYYILFAAMGSSGRALAAESLPMAAFASVAIVGFKRCPWLLVLGLAGHGVFDLAHSAIISNPGVPRWWPGFCLAYDFTAALYLAVLLKRQHSRNAA